MPGESAVRKGAIQDKDGFSAKYARELRADIYTDHIIEISASVRPAESIVAVQAAKLAADNRKWLACKMAPK
jgi:hypothetical protein